MSEHFSIRGICSACKTGAVCDDHQSRALLECQNFQPLNDAPVELTAAFAPYYRDMQTFHGLCRDCEIRAECVEAYHTGGIWICNQYR